MVADIGRALDDRLLDLHTGQPGRVVAFYADTYEVDVELVCRRPVPHAGGGYAYEEQPIIPHVMVCAFGNDQSWMRMALKKGDLVWILSPEVSTDEFIETGDVSQPANVTRHGLLGSLAIPFVLPSRTPSGHLVSLAGGADYVALAAKVDKALSDIVSWTKDQNAWDASHTHGCPPLGGPSSPPVQLPPPEAGTPASTAATQVKAT